jgi:hypothetical protein
MNRAILSRALLFTLPLGAALAIGGASDAQAQEVYIGPPPAAYIATVQPEYYEGHPVYFYNGYWHYREGGRWAYYHGEPPYLHDRRGHWEEHARYHYYR